LNLRICAADPWKKRGEPDTPKRASSQPPRRLPEVDGEDVVIVRGPPPPVYYGPGRELSIGVGIGGLGGGGFERGGARIGRQRGGY
jgi:hypothetical protein